VNATQRLTTKTTLTPNQVLDNQQADQQFPGLKPKSPVEFPRARPAPPVIHPSKLARTPRSTDLPPVELLKVKRMRSEGDELCSSHHTPPFTGSGP